MSSDDIHGGFEFTDYADMSECFQQAMDRMAAALGLPTVAVPKTIKCGGIAISAGEIQEALAKHRDEHIEGWDFGEGPSRTVHGRWNELTQSVEYIDVPAPKGLTGDDD